MLPALLRQPTVRGTRWLKALPRIAVFLWLSLTVPPMAGAHDPEPVVDVSRSIGPIDPRLDYAGETIAFSYQGIWRMPRGGGVHDPTHGGGGIRHLAGLVAGREAIAFIPSSNFAAGALRLIRAEEIGSDIPLPGHVPPGASSSSTRPGPASWASSRRRVRNSPWPGSAWGRDVSSRCRPDCPGSGTSPSRATGFDRPGPRPRTCPASSPATTVPRPTSGRCPPRGEARKVVRFPARIHELCWTAGDRALVVATELGGVHNDLWEVPLDDPGRAPTAHVGPATRTGRAPPATAAGCSTPTTAKDRPRSSSAT